MGWCRMSEQAGCVWGGVALRVAVRQVLEVGELHRYWGWVGGCVGVGRVWLCVCAGRVGGSGWDDASEGGGCG
jgi:hypothetical protein